LKALEKENGRLKRLLADAELDKAILKEAASGNFWARRSGKGQSNMLEMHSGATAQAERRACQVLGQPRSTQRRKRQIPCDEPGLVRRITELASE